MEEETHRADQEERDRQPFVEQERVNQVEEDADLDLVQALAAVDLGDNDDALVQSGIDAPAGIEGFQENRDDLFVQQNSISQDNINLDPLKWSPLSPEELGANHGPSSLLFSSEELYEVLQGIGSENDNNNDHKFGAANTSRETSFSHFNTTEAETSELNFLSESALLQDPLLPDFQFRDTSADDSDEDSQLLLPIQDLARIFDDNEQQLPQDDQKENSVVAASTPEEQAVLEKLQGLSLTLPPPSSLENEPDGRVTEKTDNIVLNNADQEPTPQENVDTFIEEDIPPYMYCQLCEASDNVNPAFNLSDDNLLTLALEPLENGDPQYMSELDNLISQLGESSEAAAADTMDSEAHTMEDQPQIKPLVVSPAVMGAAQPFLDTFGVGVTPFSETPRPEAPPRTTREIRAERPCLGHRDRILNAEFSPQGTYLATASADSTIRLWRSATNQLVCTLKHHNSEYECLRVAWASPEWLNDDNVTGPPSDENALLATSGADGQVFVLRQSHTNGDTEEWEVVACIDHAQGLKHFQPTDAEDRPQIYALQFVQDWQVMANKDDNPHNRVLLTSSEDHIHVWQLVQDPAEQDQLMTVDEGNEEEEDSDANNPDTPTRYPWHFREVFSIGFGDLHSMGYGVSVGRVTEQASQHLPFTNARGVSVGHAFGGERNPNGVVFVFDAGYCSVNGLLGVALSDGSLRLMNGRGICLTVLQLPGQNTHLTSFCWDATGTRLATSVAATGHVVTWEVLLNENKTDVQKTACRAIMGGGHDKTVFGTRYVGGDSSGAKHDPLLLSWGADGRLVLWDAQCTDEVDFGIATLVNNPNYPIYGLDFHERSRHMAVVGGGSDGGFIGIPVSLYDVHPEARIKTPNRRKEDTETMANNDDTKKPKLEDDD